MAFCSNCGKEISDGVRFCSNCGASIGDEPQVNPAGNTPVNNTNVNASNNMYISRADLNSYVDPTRAYVIPPQPTPEPTGIDKFGKFFWISLVILTIVDFVSDPAVVTILLSAAIIGGSIFALTRKYKFKGMLIVCIVLAAICMIAGVSHAKKYGLFKIPSKADYTSTADKDEEVSDSTSKPDTTAKPNDSKSNSSTTDSNPADNVGKSDSAAAPDVRDSEPAKSTDNSSADTKTGGVDPELKAFLDSYEEFVDEYVEFMKNYMANPLDVGSMLGDYTDMMTKLADFETKLDKYDTDDMSTEDAAYYLEVTTRCTQKMLGVL